MTDDEVLSEFRASEALLEGHFKLSSGRHSAVYLQCARVLMNAERAARLATALVQKIPRDLRQQVEATRTGTSQYETVTGHVDRNYLKR